MVRGRAGGQAGHRQGPSAHAREAPATSAREAHQAIEWLLRTALGAEAGPKPVISAPALIAVQAFKAWALRVTLKPILIERIVYSKRHRYAGTLDLLARVDGVLTMIDFKTGKAVYHEAHLQAAAYSAALEEMGYREPTQSLIVRLPKVAGDPPVEVVPVPAARRAVAGVPRDAPALGVDLGERSGVQGAHAQDAEGRRPRPAVDRSRIADRPRPLTPQSFRFCDLRRGSKTGSTTIHSQT